MPEPKDYIRPPTSSEEEYFKSNKHVGGMATEDGRIIINPFSDLSSKEKEAVAKNEMIRLLLRSGEMPRYKGSLTEEQKAMLDSNTYASASREDRADTIIARLMSGDPSAGEPNISQKKYLKEVESFFSKQETSLTPK